MKIFFLFLLFPLSSAWSGIYFNVLWKNYELTTCFAAGESEERVIRTYTIKAGEWSKKDKQNVEKWISEEFTYARTGIHFTGFTNCEDTPDADIVLFYNKNSVVKNFFDGLSVHGFASLGAGSYEIEGFPNALGLVTLSKSKMRKGTAVHEFGHVAGLMHEDAHHDAVLESKKCTDTYEFFHKSPLIIYEPYDKDSVMSYCKLQLSKYNNGLSPDDVKLLRKLYP